MVHIGETCELYHLDFSRGFFQKYGDRNMVYPNMAMLFEKSNLNFGVIDDIYYNYIFTLYFQRNTYLGFVIFIF